MNESSDINLEYNPYDFGNPVSDEQLFSGRTRELDEVKYYLDQAAHAPRAINLALIGERASGKTSLLNMIEKQAEMRDFCVVRVDLNEGDVESQLFFFYKIFDAILTAVCETRSKSEQANYCFEGVTGKTYETYLDVTNAFVIPEDKTWSPFVFPIQYAKAMSSNISQARISDNIFKSDLRIIREEAGKTIIVLFDECNVLTQHRVLLEMLRNIFMNLSGYMLVFSGTEDLFPVMDDVFSPIVRQFKKIKVEAFKRDTETKECIEKPLKKIGIEDYTKIFNDGTLNELRQVHELTGGRPYEIQLLCHFMFKRIQQRMAKKMELNLEVLDDVLVDLTRGHDLSFRPIIAKVKEFDRKQLIVLNKLTNGRSDLTFDQICNAEFIFSPESFSAEELTEFLNYFKAQGIINENHGLIRFAGDEFDKIYLKYYAKQKKRANLNFLGRSFEDLLIDRTNVFFQQEAKLLPISSILDSEIVYQNSLRQRHRSGRVLLPLDEIGQLNIFDLVKEFAKPRGHDVFKLSPKISKTLYWMMFEERNSGKNRIRVHNINISSHSINLNLAFIEVQEIGKLHKKKFAANLHGLVSRAEEVGVKITHEVGDIKIIPEDVIVNKLNQTVNRAVRQDIGESHLSAIAIHYMSKPRKMDLCTKHANTCNLIEIEMETGEMNNLGYFHLAEGNLEKAEELFSLASQHTTDESYQTLATYNLAITNLKQNNIEEGFNLLKSITSKLDENNIDTDAFEQVVVFALTLENEKLNFKEIGGSLIDIAKESLKSLESFRDLSSNSLD